MNAALAPRRALHKYWRHRTEHIHGFAGHERAHSHRNADFRLRFGPFEWQFDGHFTHAQNYNTVQLTGLLVCDCRLTFWAEGNFDFDV